ncbi:hypothetical protein J6590_084903 [Homalodisca vitripennis]|nr:hypothetical protein J6590_084903 [Homalodisca vitripennis]
MGKVDRRLSISHEVLSHVNLENEEEEEDVHASGKHKLFSNLFYPKRTGKAIHQGRAFNTKVAPSNPKSSTVKHLIPICRCIVLKCFSCQPFRTDFYEIKILKTNVISKTSRALPPGTR